MNLSEQSSDDEQEAREDDRSGVGGGIHSGGSEGSNRAVSDALSHVDVGQGGHSSSKSGVGRSDNAVSDSVSRVSVGTSAVIGVVVENDSSSDDVVDASVKSKGVEDVVVISGSVIGIDEEVTHISNIVRSILSDNGDSVDSGRIVVRSSEVSSS